MRCFYATFAYLYRLVYEMLFLSLCNVAFIKAFYGKGTWRNGWKLVIYIVSDVYVAVLYVCDVKVALVRENLQ